MKKNILTLIVIFSFLMVHSQTIVKMNVPPQAKELLQVIVLFDEEVPEGMPVVLGLMGYKVTGGIEPYTYEWLQNGQIIGTGDVVVVTPAKGDRFELKATDKNRCFSVSSFTMKVISQIEKYEENDKNNEYKIYPTLVKNAQINIELPKTEIPIKAKVRIFDIKGTVQYQSFITGSNAVNCELINGTYFVSVQTDDFHKVEKIIVNH
ncbi:MAG TPA: T9SS type A sorting domain-containing protein [Paludibacteraceae bacterium]|nr:T9SS type A sorting domain-containing protein [Paludibacteraceae bacterium]HPK20937.1 T9SS type A sorting domain-containing protein [Paludibacteraceae bacterium]